MARLNDWEARLAQHIEDWRYRKFEYGKADCALFCLHAEIAMYGKSRFEHFLGQYKTHIGSLKALKKLGAGNLVDTVADKLEEIPLAMARRGDVGCVDVPDGDGLVIILGDKTAGMADDGLNFLPIGQTKRAWSL